MLFKFGLADSPLCYFCNKDLETLEQFFYTVERFIVKVPKKGDLTECDN